MTNIVVHQPNAIAIALQKAPAPLQPFIRAFESKRIADCSPSEIREIISEGLTIAHFNMGRKMPDDNDAEACKAFDAENEFTIEQLYPDIVSMFSSMHVKEFPLACRRGSLGLYGENFGLSVATIFRWVQSFVNDPTRLNAKKELVKLNEKPSGIPELTRIDRIDFANRAFNQFKKIGSYEDYGNVIYNFLDSESLIPFSNSEKNDIKNEALHAELEHLSEPQTLIDHRNAVKRIEELMSDDSSIISKAKRLALKKLFKRLADADQKLEFTISVDAVNI